MNVFKRLLASGEISKRAVNCIDEKLQTYYKVIPNGKGDAPKADRQPMLGWGVAGFESPALNRNLECGMGVYTL